MIENKTGDILDKFIAAFKEEFKDENWDYLYFVADRVRTADLTENSADSNNPTLKILSEENRELRFCLETHKRISKENNDILYTALDELWKHTHLTNNFPTNYPFHRESLYGKVQKALSDNTPI